MYGVQLEPAGAAVQCTVYREAGQGDTGHGPDWLVTSSLAETSLAAPVYNVWDHWPVWGRGWGVAEGVAAAGALQRPGDGDPRVASPHIISCCSTGPGCTWPAQGSLTWRVVMAKMWRVARSDPGHWPSVQRLISDWCLCLVWGRGWQWCDCITGARGQQTAGEALPSSACYLLLVTPWSIIAWPDSNAQLLRYLEEFRNVTDTRCWKHG